MQRNLQTHQINPTAFSGRCYLGLSGVGLSAKWLRGLDLNQRPLGYEGSRQLILRDIVRRG
jgi:hypothetical protein